MPSPPEPDDEVLFAAYLSGDAAALETIFQRWQAPLRRHLGRILDDEAAADDLVVETTLRPWLFTIARNLARNRLRSLRVWRWLPLTSIRARAAPPERDAEVRRRVA